jgi:hypothetical protein
MPTEIISVSDKTSSTLAPESSYWCLSYLQQKYTEYVALVTTETAKLTTLLAASDLAKSQLDLAQQAMDKMRITCKEDATMSPSVTPTIAPTSGAPTIAPTFVPTAPPTYAVVTFAPDSKVMPSLDVQVSATNTKHLAFLARSDSSNGPENYKCPVDVNPRIMTLSHRIQEQKQEILVLKQQMQQMQQMQRKPARMSGKALLKGLTGKSSSCQKSYKECVFTTNDRLKCRTALESCQSKLGSL